MGENHAARQRLAPQTAHPAPLAASSLSRHPPQCIGVGRVDMKALRGKYDVYVIQVGSRQHAE